MIHVEEALKILEEKDFLLASVNMDLQHALGHVLAADVCSPIDMPSFDQSAMDGYALNFENSINSYQLVGEVAAGSAQNPKLKLGEGVRIFTGAMVPDDANIVVQQEWVVSENGKATITEPVKIGRNIRLKGEQIKAGSVALEKGTIITPAGIGFLTGLGIHTIPVHLKPKVAIVTTGNELVEVGNELLPGQIYESNSAMLAAVLTDKNFTNYSLQTVADNYEDTKKMIHTAIQDNDVLILTGGISVGDYDFVGKALDELGVGKLFYKINQKPGKPIYMGKKDSTIVAALPGNPAAALTCFYMYVLPTLNRMMGKKFEGLKCEPVQMGESYNKKGSRAEFLKAKIIDNKAYVLDMQSSAMLRSFAVSDALVYISASANQLVTGDRVLAYYLE